VDSIAAIGRKRKVNNIWEEMKSEEASLRNKINVTQRVKSVADGASLKVSNAKRRKIAEVVKLGRTDVNCIFHFG
jgi:hypothetical protein